MSLWVRSRFRSEFKSVKCIKTHEPPTSDSMVIIKLLLRLFSAFTDGRKWFTVGGRDRAMSSARLQVCNKP